MNHEVHKYIEYASGYLDLKMYEAALEEVERALAIEAGEPHALAMKAAVLWQANRLAEAEPCLAKLAELNPQESSLWINLAYIRRRTRSLDAAIETLQHAFDANHPDALAHFNMACYRAVQHHTREALELLRSALTMDPQLRTLAKAEQDFESIRQLPEFQQLLKHKPIQKKTV